MRNVRIVVLIGGRPAGTSDQIPAATPNVSEKPNRDTLDGVRGVLS